MATQVRDRLLSLHGIQSVEVNGVTGSILISYDNETVPLKTLWTALSDLDCVPRSSASLPTASVRGAEGMHAEWADKATSFVVETLIQKIAEVSTMTLLRAFI